MPNYSPEQRQEDKSRHQLGERFNERGWITDDIKRDLGEDLLARVYVDCKSTGLSFLIQLKSCIDISKQELKKTQVISYTFEVKHLVHWEISATPVIIIVWDVVLKYGYWATVTEAVTELDKNNPDWRKGQDEVNVHFSLCNSTDDAGLDSLHLQLIKECESSVSRWFMTNSNLVFPNTPEAKPDLEMFMRGKATGERITIDGKYLQFDERTERLLAPIRGWEKTVTISTPPSQETHPIRLEAESADGIKADIPYIDLHLIEKGDTQFSFSNGYKSADGSLAQNATPFLVMLTQKSGERFPQFKLTTVGSSPTAQEIRAAIPFLEIFV